MRKTRSASAPVVRVTVIGKCEIALGRSRVRPDAAVFFALLFYLGMRAGARVTRDELLELLWTDERDAARRHALRQMLYRVRRAGLEIEGDGPALAFNVSRIVCDLARLSSDAWAAEVGLADIPSPALILPSYDSGITRPYAEWVDSVRSRAAAQIRRAALRHAEVATREGRWQDVERVARLALAADPLNEPATLALAEATAMSGSKAEALRILDAYLWEIGDRSDGSEGPARLLRRRIADVPQFRIPRAADPPLIARSRELAWLNAHLERAAAGTAVTALLVGPPGIGKTAVARGFMAHAEMRGWRPVTSRLQPSDVDRPMSVFADLLPVLLRSEGALGAAPESIAQLRRLIEYRTEDDILSGKSQEAEAVQARIRSSLQDLLGAVTHEGPLILLLEDLHWIDNRSLKVLAWIVEHAPNLPVLWLFTARLESRFADLRAAFPDDRTPTLTVEPLDRESATLLFRSIASSGDAAGVEVAAEHALAVTGGNPLFVREVASHWAGGGSTEALPTNLRALMRTRVSRLSPEAQRVLHCCAVLGRFATVPRVAAVLEISTSALLSCIEEVDALGLSGLGGEPGSLVLHDLWQEELTSGLRPAPRALLHLRCGDVLYEEGSTAKGASLITEGARHLVLAGARAKGLVALEEAAAHHRRNGMPDDALSALDAAICLCETVRDRLRVHEQRVDVLRALGGWQEIRHTLTWAIPAEREQSPATSEHSVLELADVEATLLADTNTSETLRRASICAVAPNADDLHRATACRLGARAAANLYNAEMLTSFRTIVDEIAQRSPDARRNALSVGVVYHTEVGDLETALATASALVSAERASGSVGGLTRALRFHVVPLRAMRQFDRATAAGAEAFQIAASGLLVEEAAAAADIVAWTRFHAGDTGAALEWLRKAEPWISRVPQSYISASAQILRAMIAIEGHRPDAAAAAIASPIDFDIDYPVTRHRLFYLAVYTRIALLGGRIEKSVGLYERLHRGLMVTRAFRHTEYLLGALIHAARMLGQQSGVDSVLADFAQPLADPSISHSRFVVEALA